MQNKDYYSKDNFQEFVIGTICNYLNYCKDNKISKSLFESYGAKYAVKNGLISHYASIYKLHTSGKFINLWQKTFNKTGENKNIKFCDTLLMSKSAFELLNKIQKIVDGEKSGINSYYEYRKNHNKSYKAKDELLYWENITPNGVVFDKICKLYAKHKNYDIEIQINEVKKCFKNHKLLLLTKAEAEFLDKSFRSNGEAFERISYLYEKNDFALCLKGEYFERNEALSENDFIGVVKKYFEDTCFII